MGVLGKMECDEVVWRGRVGGLERVMGWRWER